MSQIFSPRAGLYAKLALLAVLGFISAGVLAWRGLTGAPHGIDEPVNQPVPFSHKHHVGDDGIDCRYCHSTVETEAAALIPSVSTCMTCHSQLFTGQEALAPVVRSWRSGVPLRWQRVHDLPGFVYFNHSIHVVKGHGRVDRMPLTARTQSLSMAWCLECHRAPAQHLRPRDKIFDMDWRARDQDELGAQLMQRYGVNAAVLTECSTCHR